MDACCAREAKDGTKAGKKDEGCCEACPDAGCEGCECSKPENASGCCMGGGCGCGNGR